MNTTYRAYVVGASAGGIFVRVPQLGDGEYGPLEIVKDSAGLKPIYQVADRVVIGQVGPTPEDFIVIGHASRYEEGGSDDSAAVPDPGADGAMLVAQNGTWVLDTVTFASAAASATKLQTIFGSGTTLPINRGGTGSTTAAGARTALELGNVNNTSDLNKPISNATKTYVDFSVAARPHPENMIVNGAGELDGLGGWTPASAVTWDPADAPTGLPGSFKGPNSGSTLQGQGFVDVEPEAEYLFEIWLKADKPGSVMYLEVRNQVNAWPGTFYSADGLPNAASSTYLVSNFLVPTVWTKYTARLVTSSTTSKVRIGGVYFNHTNGTERTATQAIAGLRMRPRVQSINLANGSVGSDKLGTTALALIDAKADKNSPTFTGTVSGITKAMVGLGSVDNTSDANKPISTATQTALNAKANLASPTFTGTVSGITKAMVGLGSVDNTSDANKPVSTATQTALDLKANLASPTFTGTVSGITKAMVGLGNVDNTADSAKPISTATQTALNLKANLASPTFTGTVSGITKTMVGLGNVDNTADSAKPVSTAMQTALNGKANTTHGHALTDANMTGVLPVAQMPAHGHALTDTNMTGVLPLAQMPAHGHALTDANMTGILPIAQIPVAASGTSNSTQVVRADDSRLSNARTPVAHTHTPTDISNLASSANVMRVHTDPSASTTSGMMLVIDHNTGDAYIRRDGVTKVSFNGNGVMTGGTIPYARMENPPELDGTHLNYRVINGMYHCSNNGNAIIANGFPEEQAGMLEVANRGDDNFVYQRYTTYAHARTWTRAQYAGAWSGWKLISKSGRAAGMVSVTNAANAVGSATVSFPSGRFRSNPTAVVTAWTGGPQSVFASNGDPSTTSMSIFVFRSVAATTKVGWIAEEFG